MRLSFLKLVGLGVVAIDATAVAEPFYGIDAATYNVGAIVGPPAAAAARISPSTANAPSANVSMAATTVVPGRWPTPIS